MGTATGWIPGRSAQNSRYQKLTVQFTAAVGGGDVVTVPFISGEFISAFIDVNTLKATTSTIVITADGQTYVNYTAPGGPVDLVMYPFQDGGVTNANGALTTKSSTPRVVSGNLVFTLANANAADNPAVTVWVRV
jgi:hypothetical protein